MSENDRLGRIEAMIEIGQLPPRFAFACDSRDFDALVALYVEDVKRPPDMEGVGREALKAFFAGLLDADTRGMHQILGHQIDLVDADHATGEGVQQGGHTAGGEDGGRATPARRAHRAMTGSPSVAMNVLHRKRGWRSYADAPDPAESSACGVAPAS